MQQFVGNGQSNFNITMTPLEERKISQQEMMRRVRTMLRKYQADPRVRVTRFRRHRYFGRLNRRRRR